jgi:hypothetical protein
MSVSVENISHAKNSNPRALFFTKLMRVIIYVSLTNNARSSVRKWAINYIFSLEGLRWRKENACYAEILMMIKNL